MLQSGNRATQPPKEFQRAYIACTRCRKTKAKCELSTDSEACLKCLRERRECLFDAERSTKRRRVDGRNDIDVVGRPEGSGRITRKDSTRPFAEGHVHLDSGIPAASHSDVDTPCNHDQPPYRVRVQPGTSNLDADVMQTVVSSSKDALGLLFKAAEQHDSDESDDQAQIDVVNNLDTGAFPQTPKDALATLPTSVLSNPPKEILDLWSHTRFVRQGWFSPKEAVTYVDLFFRNLSPLSLISNSFYSSHDNHKSLILEEPLLCCALLMVSSRYHVLPGVGGASRAHFIHERLWRHCENLIQRITSGQEKGPIPKLRTLGTIKALTLITEWHPRALHFPPDSDGWDSSLAPSLEIDGDSSGLAEDASLTRWREEVFEPAKRSDRMSWMLLGLATILGHELGIFDEDNSEADELNAGADAISKLRLRRLLFLNVNQLAMRLGCSSFLPPSSSQSISYPTELSDHPDYEKDTLISLWIDITKLLKTVTEMFFSSRASTRHILRSGRYVSMLDHFQPLLAQWYKGFSEFSKTIYPPEPSVDLLFVDYSYVRMYLNSIAMQALVERATTGKGKSDMDFDYDFLRFENRAEYAFNIQEVIDASRDILSSAILLAERGILRFAPVRLFLRITSASIFLLKAISLGVRNSELQRSLDTLDRCIHALRSSSLDDIHLSSRYAVLMERHVRRFRRNFRVHSGSGNHAVPPSPRRSEAPPSSNPQRTGTVAADLPYYPGSTDNLNAFYGQPGPDDAIDDWLVQPFDPSIAPFGMGINQSASGLELDSLDFLWNMNT